MPDLDRGVEASRGTPRELALEHAAGNTGQLVAGGDGPGRSGERLGEARVEPGGGEARVERRAERGGQRELHAVALRARRVAEVGAPGHRRVGHDLVARLDAE